MAVNNDTMRTEDGSPVKVETGNVLVKEKTVESLLTEMLLELKDIKELLLNQGDQN